MKGQTDINRYCLIVGSTDVGRKRSANEDNMGNFDTCNGLVSVVCDGMGGHVGGATASRIAVETIHNFLNRQYYDDAREAIGMAIESANHAILAEAVANPELRGMGSTCVLLLIRDGKVYIGHVGDSRIYHIRGNIIQQLTKDHSYVQMLVDCNQITKEQAEQHPRKNEITNALGIPDMTPATVKEEAMTPDAGDCFLLCSDGLSGMVSEREILSIVSQRKEMGTQERADCLVQRANEHGGNDNITVQLVEFASVPKSANKFPFKYCLIGILALLLFGSIFVACFLKDDFFGEHKKTMNDSTSVNTNQVGLVSDIQPDIINLGSVNWCQNFRFLTINYSEESAKLTLKQKVTGRADIDVVAEKNILGTFNPGSLSCCNDGVKFGSEGKVSYLEFKEKEPVNYKIEFKLEDTKNNVSHSFIVEVITPVSQQGNTTSKSGEKTKEETPDTKSILKVAAEETLEESKPIEYKVSINYNKIDSTFLKVFADEYQVVGGTTKAKINIEMELPSKEEDVKVPDYVKVDFSNKNAIYFSIKKQGKLPNTPFEFDIEIKKGKIGKIIFNCKFENK